MSEQIITKRCRCCKRIKPISGFYKSSRHQDGYENHCKTCHCKEAAVWRKTDVGKRSLQKGKIKYRSTARGKKTEKLYARKWRCTKAYQDYKKTELYKHACRKAALAYWKRNPEKAKANKMVNNAIATGKLPRPDSFKCACGEQAKHYHHHSYAQEHWLDVIAVCRSCHIKLHTIYFYSPIGCQNTVLEAPDPVSSSEAFQ